MAMSYDSDTAGSAPSFPPQRLRLPLSPVRVTYVLIALNVLIFLLSLLLGDIIYNIGALAPFTVIFYGQWWRLLTAGFLHADILHIAFNMYALRGLGTLGERFFGWRRFLIVYAFALLGTGVVVTLLSPLEIPTVGASGAIMGLLGALVVYYWQYRDQLVGGRNYLNELIKMALVNIGIGLLPGISLWGHLGGFLAGVLVAGVVYPRYAYPDEYGILKRQPLTWRAWLGTMLLFLGEATMLFLAILLRR